MADGYSSTWAGITKEVERACPGSDPAVIFPFMELGRGVGNVVSGPLSEFLLKAPILHGAGGLYGSEYGSLVLCTGVTALLGGIAVVFHWLKCI